MTEEHSPKLQVADRRALIAPREAAWSSTDDFLSGRRHLVQLAELSRMCAMFSDLKVTAELCVEGSSKMLVVDVTAWLETLDDSELVWLHECEFDVAQAGLSERVLEFFVEGQAGSLVQPANETCDAGTLEIVVRAVQALRWIAVFRPYAHFDISGLTRALR
jgi:hypothetical protein